MSWPILGTVLFLMVSNELYKQYYASRGIQLTMLFFVLFVSFSFLLPSLLRSLNPWVFILSGVLSAG
ncbi:MAG: hypothetical protein AAB093_03085, partial [Nitrospirota bacterium]